MPSGIFWTLESRNPEILKLPRFGYFWVIATYWVFFPFNDFQVEIKTSMQVPENYQISRKFQAHFQEDQNSENLIGKSISVTKIEWK